jgi:hypothetical protein
MPVENVTQRMILDLLVIDDVRNGENQVYLKNGKSVKNI